MSGLTKKAVYVDEVLSSLLGAKVGDHVSYADISRGLHKYIKDNKLRNEEASKRPRAPKIPQETVERTATQETPPSLSPSMKNCRDCGVEIPIQAVFCDLCGVSQ